MVTPWDVQMNFPWIVKSCSARACCGNICVLRTQQKSAQKDALFIVNLRDYELISYDSTTTLGGVVRHRNKNISNAAALRQNLHATLG